VPGAILGRVDKGQECLHQGSAVGQCVMTAQQDGASAAIAVEQVRFPQRPTGIQRASSLLADVGMQLRVVTRRGSVKRCR
jgi:hypothetical protein